MDDKSKLHEDHYAMMARLFASDETPAREQPPRRKPQRRPRRAPFRVGTRIRYRGPLDVRDLDGSPIMAPGLEVVVSTIMRGRQGTGMIICWDEDDEPCYDLTTDDRCVYEVTNLSGRVRRRCIHAKDKRHWKVIP